MIASELSWTLKSLTVFEFIWVLSTYTHEILVFKSLWKGVEKGAGGRVRKKQPWV